MAEYFKRDTLLKVLENAEPDFYEDYGDGVIDWGFGRRSIQDMINDIPTADVAPVVRGRWVMHYRNGTPVAGGYVSTCCDMWNNRKSNYCPNCGAKMDDDKNNA